MNLMLIERDEIRADGTAVFRGRRRQHAVQVLQAKAGDALRIGIVNGPRGQGEVLEVSDQRLVLKLTLDGTTLPRPMVDLVLAMPRPLLLRRVLTQATVLGLRGLVLTNAARVEQGFFNTSLLTPAVLQPLLRWGLEQALDTHVPEVQIVRRFRRLEREVLPQLLSDCAVGLLAHPEARTTLPQAVPPPLVGRVALAIGPEGGWRDHEIAALQALGLQPFTLGQRILRVDTAVTAVLAQLDLLRRIGD